MKARLSIATALLPTIVATLASWQERPVFRAEVNYVEVTARVVDKTGRFIDGLTAKDFSVAEDRRVEPVHQVIRVSLPTPWNSSASAPPVLYRPDLPREQRVAEGRIYLLYLNSEYYVIGYSSSRKVGRPGGTRQGHARPRPLAARARYPLAHHGSPTGMASASSSPL